MEGLTVELRHAPLPRPLNRIALHHWFVIREGAAEPERWEVWQNCAARGEHWDHLHRNLMPAERGVGGGPSVVARQWSGAEAAAIAEALRRPEEYPHRSHYRYWPGPNSNTYAAWILQRAEVDCRLDPRAIGKDFGPALRGRWRLETPVLGARLCRTALELHLLTLTFGLEWEPGAILTPFGPLPLRATRP
jgi:hypothetical protein